MQRLSRVSGHKASLYKARSTASISSACRFNLDPNDFNVRQVSIKPLLVGHQASFYKVRSTANLSSFSLFNLELNDFNVHHVYTKRFFVGHKVSVYEARSTANISGVSRFYLDLNDFSVLLVCWSGGGTHTRKLHARTRKLVKKGTRFCGCGYVASRRAALSSWSWSRGVVRPVLKKCHFVAEIPIFEVFC